jgi:hypothetical protein
MTPRPMAPPCTHRVDVAERRRGELRHLVVQPRPRLGLEVEEVRRQLLDGADHEVDAVGVVRRVAALVGDEQVSVALSDYISNEVQ